MFDLRDETIPLPLRWFMAHGVKRLTPWHFIEDEEERERFRVEFRREVSAGSRPVMDMWPFARRQDCDDVAGFVVADGRITAAVIDVHLTYSAGPERDGYPSTQLHSSFWDWLRAALADTADFCSEEDLKDLL